MDLSLVDSCDSQGKPLEFCCASGGVHFTVPVQPGPSLCRHRRLGHHRLAFTTGSDLSLSQLAGSATQLRSVLPVISGHTGSSCHLCSGVYLLFFCGWLHPMVSRLDTLEKNCEPVLGKAANHLPNAWLIHTGGSWVTTSGRGQCGGRHLERTVVFYCSATWSEYQWSSDVNSPPGQGTVPPCGSRRQGMWPPWPCSHDNALSRMSPSCHVCHREAGPETISQLQVVKLNAPNS